MATYQIAVTTQDYCNKTMDLKNNTTGASFSNVSQTYDAPSDSCYVTSNGGWYLNDSSLWKYFLDPNTVYTLMDDTVITPDTSHVQYSGGDITKVASGTTTNGYWWQIKTGSTGNFGFYISYDNASLPRYTHPIMLKGAYNDCIPRSTIYSDSVVLGSTSTTNQGSGAVHGSSLVSGSGTVIFGANGAISGRNTMSEGSQMTMTSSGSVQGVASASEASKVILHSATVNQGSGAISGSSILSGSPKIVAKVEGNVNSRVEITDIANIKLAAAGSVQGSSKMVFKDPTSTHISVLNFQGSLSTPINLAGTTSPDIQLLGSFNDMSFVGSKNPDISLKGGI